MAEFQELEDYLDESASPGKIDYPSCIHKVTDKPSKVSRGQRLRQGYDTTRFVRGGIRGGQSGRFRDDLRPAPLQTSGMSWVDMLQTEPPAGFNSDFGANEPDSEASKQQQVKNKKSFASFKRVFSRKQETTEALPNAIELEKVRKGHSNSLGGGHIPLLTPQDLYTTSNSADHEALEESLKEQTSPTFRMNKPPMTPPRLMNTASSLANLPLEKDLKGNSNFSSGRKVSTTTPLKSPLPIFSSQNPSPVPSPRKVSFPAAIEAISPTGSVTPRSPSAVTRPALEHKVTEEHLSLTSFPPVPKEDLARLPKELEPTVPDTSSIPFNARRPSLPQLSMAAVAEEPQTPGPFLLPELPEPRRDRNGKLKRFENNEPFIKTLEFRTFAQTYGYEAAIARFADDATVNAAIMQAKRSEVTDDSVGLGISAHTFMQSTTGVNVRAERGDSCESNATPFYTPTTSRSGNQTPKTPIEVAEYYMNLPRSGAQQGKDAKSPYGAHPEGYGDLAASPTLTRVNESNTSTSPSPFDDPSRVGPSQQSSEGSYTTGALTGPSRKLFVDTSLAQSQNIRAPPAVPSRAVTPLPANAPSMEKIKMYFRQFDPEGLRSLRYTIDEETRLETVGHTRS